ncbi:MogA/MoaB family molybdenum cofactor biosynthesis protein [Allonocardiopsis opalescens]|uniref:Molybdopterin adenylyltransferase n=1 Tax=Allonocardiopsis opalescens TaxID=1144618 RepID=A0A2T0Q9B9_9ACTN|nr:MogA/MoaB family molybdenum cofactor biosynthesis protein [Allonocardiopsis opalescens]PRY00437.1 molybdopterin adenylyltransferase [Allonocardiopsis opalescens]
MRAIAITASNRAAAGVYDDTSGPLLVRLLTEAGCTADGPRVVPDGPEVAAEIAAAAEAGYDIAVTTGGTGISPTDATPEVTRPLLRYEIPGIAEALRAKGVEAGVPAAVLSRGLAGVVERGGHRTLVVNLPGSTGGVRDGMAVLGPLLAHAVGQMRGRDHERGAAADPPPAAGG